ncbi:MAG: ribosome biogenesis GTP-binding protein YihA/YsxC [Hyphomicrobium sp.]|nr:ribosome biogenesis GTP-binding protein YihA/YsxC [Hyphomicrobium sp.]
MDSLAFSAEDLEDGRRLFEQPWRFVKGVVGLEHLPPSGPPEIALAGRSNVGKSSLINALVRQNGLARTSNTPGRTQELNFFVPDDGRLYLVDMPGYGFAKAPKPIVEAWTGLVKSYLAGRQRLARVFLLIDARHGIKSVDEEIMRLLDEAAVSYQIVLTKTDKISAQALADVTRKTAAVIGKRTAAFPSILETSSETGTGIDDLRAEAARVTRAYTSG